MTTFLEEIRKIEKKWQKKWQEDQIFIGNVDSSKPKWFLTVSYPYATAPLHIGHARTYGLGDIFARFKTDFGALSVSYHWVFNDIFGPNSERLYKDSFRFFPAMTVSMVEPTPLLLILSR